MDLDKDLNDVEKVKAIRTLAYSIFLKWQSYFEELPDKDFIGEFWPQRSTCEVPVPK